ncbi:MAG: FtsX-like permease family protein [Oscillospiraceae bacterium]|nr:FtsX-like permease family protein [Oscillospiraceae bacterium]
MNSETRKMLLRSIRATFGRFLAILAITALGVGFYAGLKSSQPDMLRSADDYLRRQKMYDLQLMSSLGLMKSDPAAFRRLPGVDAAEGACFADAYARVGEGEEEVWHFQTLTRDVAVPELLLGRLPEGADECLGDSSVFKEEDLGRHIVLTDSNSEDTLEHFAGRDFTLVGIARSPRYISVDRGSSELGSGRPAGFVLLPAAAFTDEVYHELLLWLDLPGEIYSEEYTDALRRLRPSVETLLNRRGLLRAEALRRENSEELLRARKELDDGWSEYRLGLQQAAQELAEGEQKLQAAQDTLDAGWAELVKNEADLAANYRDFNEDYAAFQSQYGNAVDLDALEGLLNNPGALESGNLGEIVKTLTGVLPDLTQPLDQLSDTLSDLERQFEESGLTGLLEGLDGVEIPDFSGTEEAFDQLKGLDTEKLMALLTKKMELDMTRSTLQASRARMEEAEEQLADGRYEYQQGKEKAERELADARKKLEDAEKELAEGEAELEDSLRPELFTLDRTSNPGYVTFENDSAIVDGIAVVFPVFFVLVAALVCVTTMTRMVNEERTQIGTLKAMGYSSPVIMAKYLLYAGLSALLGCLLGFFLGATGLPYLVWYAYNIMYQYEDLLFHFSPFMLAACLLVSVAGSLFVTWLACRTALTEKPAELIRPKAPAVGKRVLLERIGPLWRRLPFLSKVSIRNAFRYPSRVFMMLLGIGGCTALMVAGFGAKDSLAGVGGFQYDEISLYDVVVTLDPDKTGQDPGALWDGWAEHAAAAHREEIRLLNRDGAGKDTELILAEAGDITPLLSLHTKSREALPWPGKGEAVITAKLSDTLGLRAGDTAVLRLSSGREQSVTISGVCEYYVGHAVFASPEGFRDTSRNYALIRVKEGEDPGLRAARLRSEEGVNYVSLTRTERETLENSMASVDLLVLMLVFCSGALAFITLYNLTNINIMERVREVATVKVLGFTPRETAEYILNENLMLSFFGALFGLLLGKLLHRFVMLSIKLDYMTYDVRIASLSYALSFVITVVFALLTNLFMRGKLEKVNMAESLKSVE